MSKKVDEIYSRNYGTNSYYKRKCCENLNYTDGIMDFQTTLNAFWVIDVVIALLPEVVKSYQKTGDGFYIITIKVDKNSNALFEIFREGYQFGKYDEHITLSKIKILNTNLHQHNYKFYLILSNFEPVVFTFMLTSEY